MYNSERNYKKPLIAICVVAILVTIGVVIYNIMKSAELSIMVAPSTAVVKIDGKEYTNGQYRFFPKSNVEVEISSPDYQTQTLTIDLLANEVTLLRAVLKDDDGGYSSYLTSEESYEQLKFLAPLVGDKDLTNLIDLTNKKIAILDILPLNVNTGEFYADQHGFIVSMDDSLCDYSSNAIGRRMWRCALSRCLRIKWRPKQSKSLPQKGGL